MSNVFASLVVYPGKWEVVDSRAFSKEEQDAVESARVVDSEYGYSVCFLMKSGGSTFIPLSNDANASIGDSIDLGKAKLLTLGRSGSENIYRVQP